MFLNILNTLSLLLTISFCCFNSTFAQCPTPDIRSRARPSRISTPQPPYGCSQVNRLTTSDALVCFSERERSRLRSRQSRSGDVGVPVHQLIRNHGYPVEIHRVTTKDGYILKLFRIPHGKNSSIATKGPVYLTHGLLSSSAQWVVNVPDEKSLGFLLADNGYDVWLDNCRGTKYSQGHKTLKAKSDPSYWDFSWHEMGKYDLPATIDHILTNYTDKRLFYIGHSMGTTMFFTGMSLNPSYNDKIKTAYLLAPSAYLGNVTNSLQWLTSAAYYSQPYLSTRTRGSLYPSGLSRTQNVNKRFTLACESSVILCTLCINLLYSVFGLDYRQTNFNQLSVTMPHFPDEASTKSAIHYAQSIVTGKFKEFDYGPTENPRRYNGSCTPPSYNLSKVKAPVMTFWSWNDNLITPNDVSKLRAELNVIEDVEISHCSFTHLDFATANNADKLVYHKILKSMNNFDLS